MNRILLFCFFASLPVYLFSQNAFVVHGHVEGYPDGTVFTLKPFGSDTLSQGKFVIRGETKREFRSSLYIGESYLESCLVWVAPGAEIFISGVRLLYRDVGRYGAMYLVKEKKIDIKRQRKIYKSGMPIICCGWKRCIVRFHPKFRLTIR